MEERMKRMKGGFSPKIDYLGVVLCGTGVLIWLAYAWNHLSQYAYEYPVISDSRIFIEWTLVNLLVPLVLLILCCILVLKRKRVLYIICVFIFYFTTAICFFRSAAEILYMPAVHSYTNDSAQFGHYDEQPEETLKLNEAMFFPDEIPDYAENVQYCYYYEYASSVTLYIAVSWECNELHYAEALVEFSQYDDHSSTKREQVYYFPEIQSSNNLVDSYYKTAVIIDEVQQRIAYIISSHRQYLPSNMDEVFAKH